MRFSDRPAIAVVGVSALFPGSISATGFWNDILSGADLLTAVPPSHWLIDDYFDEDLRAKDKTYGRRGGFLSEVELDPMKFGIPPNMLASTDTSQLLALIVAQQVLEDAARGQFSEMDRKRCSVILGVTSGQELLGVMASRMNRPMWLQGMRRAGVPEEEAQAACEHIANLHPEWTESTFPGLLGNVVAGRIANRLDLGGTNCVTDAACASSFSALSMGVNELYLGDSDLVIAGGVDTMNDIFMYMCFSKTPALSKSEDIRPFSNQADGTMLGEGLGMVALKRLEDAERDGNDIYCVINGVGASSDGRSKSVYAPVSAGQARALSNAYDKTSYGPDTVELLEAHGTGTVAGDAAEFGGMEIAFNASGRKDRQWCALGTVKSQIGHTKAAAGAAGLFKVIMALHHKVLPQTLKIDLPNPKLDLEASPFNLNTKTRPWVRGSDHERRGSVSSFGFGGSNFHVAMSEYTGTSAKAPRLRTCDVELVLINGVDDADIIAQAKKYIEGATESGYLKWLAQTSQRANTKADARLALTAKDEVELVEQLKTAIKQIEKGNGAFSTPTGIHYGVGAEDGTVAFVFPGQGSQYLFMGADLAMNYNDAMQAWDRAADLNWENEPLHDVVFPITTFKEDSAIHQQSRLTETQWAQPAIGTTSLAMLNLLSAMGVEPAHVGGHSYGEITALHAAGVLSATQMLEVSRSRGALMAEAAKSPGAMVAVVSNIEDMRTLVDTAGVDVVIANHNSPTQVVLSGPTPAIEQIEVKLAEQGITAKRLSVATAFHSKVVSGASIAFTEFLQGIDFKKPNIPVYANETAKPYPKTAKKMRTQLGRQLANSVRFVEMIEEMYNAGARTFVEVGASSILTGLIGKILNGKEHITIPLDNKRTTGLSAFMSGLGQLVAAGVAVDFASLWEEYGEFENPHDIEKPRLVIPINGANHNKPYPPRDLTELVGPNPNRATPNPNPNPNPNTTPTQKPAMSNPKKSNPVHNAPSMASPFTAAAESRNEIAQAHVSPAIPASVLSSYEAMQNQTANAHIAYLNAMANSHSAFLATAKQGLAALGNLTNGDFSAAPIVPLLPRVEPIQMAPAPVARPVAVVAAPIFAPPIAAPVLAAVEPIAVVSAVSRPAAVLNPSPVVKKSNISRESLMALLLDVVSEKTGYPSDMLNMGMELESELGIDSIKRVEILSAMQDAVPELPEVDTSIMAELVTLGQIVDYMNGEITASEPGNSQTESAPQTAISRDGLMTLLLDVVSDKTGYPSDMLNMGMELESELGIDSIKRVEILSAMQDAVPELPEVDTSIMSELATLGQIVDYMNGEIAIDGNNEKKKVKIA